jgi:glucosamine-6-phosphate deaminase
MEYPINFQADSLKVEVDENAELLGKAASKFVEETINRAIHSKGNARIILATGASQFVFYGALKLVKSIEWKKVAVFHLDEYAGMSDKHPASFRKYLKERILNEVKPGKTHFLNGSTVDPETESERYEKLLKEEDIDLACIGIGENGHIAFNDPHVADFNDPRLVKLVELDESCRKQQLGEGWFPTFNDVPTHALTLTVPAIMRAKIISCVVPDQRKAVAVRNTLSGPVEEKCPASVLRTHPAARLFLDRDSASLLSM